MATVATPRVEAAVETVRVSAYDVPMEETESDGTLEWGSTTMILVEVEAGGERGLGYTYGDVSVAHLIESKLVAEIEGADALSPPAAWARMQAKIRNAGRPGVGAMAISCVDIALWDLKAKLLGLALADLLPRFHTAVPAYGSGGFTSYSNDRLREQFDTWVHEMGFPRVKMKVGRDFSADPGRLTAAREAIGDGVELMVDGNGAYQRKEALFWAERFSAFGVTYFEEPVSSEDLEGLRLLRDRAPAGMSIAAGEYSWDLFYSRGLLTAGAVDILQADVTRVGGITNFLRVDGLAKAHQVVISAHCAPAVSAHACCALETLEHLEYFHDHVEVEKLLFDGTLKPDGGRLVPDRSRPGLGLELKRDDAARYLVHDSEGNG
ncbi:MAG: mandelate racemase [Thermoleophilaceae bacterium]|jgi:L-alanine-DL-glutamate epimerase-like enolase superfamily enzyme|nr:mandelate racemase [Thermoleophilaceae bacterium]